MTLGLFGCSGSRQGRDPGSLHFPFLGPRLGLLLVGVGAVGSQGEMTSVQKIWPELSREGSGEKPPQKAEVPRAKKYLFTEGPLSRTLGYHSERSETKFSSLEPHFGSEAPVKEET